MYKVYSERTDNIPFAHLDDAMAMAAKLSETCFIVTVSDETGRTLAEWVDGVYWPN